MLDGRPLIDVHLHAARLPTLKPAWRDWAPDFGDQDVLTEVYDAAGTSNDRVWIELSGSPPSRLREYYSKHSWNRLTRRMIFGTDWPGVPGIARNARAVAALCPDEETAGLVLAGNAAQVYNLKVET